MEKVRLILIIILLVLLGISGILGFQYWKTNEKSKALENQILSLKQDKSTLEQDKVNLEERIVQAEKKITELEYLISRFEQGYKGRVQEKLSDWTYGKYISNAKIIFTSEDGLITREVYSDKNGYYKINLPVGRYKVKAEHPDYEQYSTGPSFFVVSENKYQVGNIFMTVKGGLSCPPSGKLSSNSSLSYKTQKDQPPSVSINVNPAKVKKGESFSITLKAEDDKGLSSMWWFGEQTGIEELDRAHMFSCNGKQNCSNIWKISVDKSGNFLLIANARDIAYPKTGEAHQASEGTGMACTLIQVTE